MIKHKQSVPPAWFEIIGLGISVVVFIASLYGLLYLI